MKDMYYLTLDTNTWIYLANGTEPVRLLTYIKQEVDKGYVTILLPEIIIKEWDKNKDNAVKQGSIKHFNDITNALDRILKLLGDKGERNILNFLLDEKEEKDSFTDFVDNYKKKREEIEEAISDNIKLIEDLFAHKSTVIIKIEDKDYIRAGQYALEKKAPFRNRNSFADALILFSLLDFVKMKSIEGTLFISYNTDDFCEKKDGKKYLHPDLVTEFKDAKAKFYTIVGEALSTMQTDIISKQELEWIKQLQDEAQWEQNIEHCRICDGNNYNFGNEVYFDGKWTLIDERKGLKYQNPNQGEFEFFRELPKTPPEKYFKEIEVGHCEWCNTEHFKCVNCGTINAVIDQEFNKRKDCEDCGTPYFIERTYDRKGVDVGHLYKILKDTKTCLKCGFEFENDGSKSDICERCEEKPVNHKDGG